MIGKVLSNRYEILERIGGGGMAIVYRALDKILNRYVSVKVLRPQFVSDPEFVHRFRREAQAAASLSHPNVVNIYDVGIEEETYYIVMEYINGKTLKEVIQERAPLPVAEAVGIAKQICLALQHAHEHQIVHRDIKPHNILIGKDGHVKVTDFGIARAITSNTITHNGSVLGSVHYFSPEQARGGITDVKSDIYSLGVVLYEMVTGELPFSGESPISVALKHLQDYFIEPRQMNPKIPQSVENVILKSLAKNPDARYQSAKEMYADLDQALLNPNVEKFVASTDLSDTQPTLQIPAAALKDAGYASKRNGNPKGAAGLMDDKEQPKKRNTWKIIGMIVGLLILGGVGIATGFTVMTSVLSVPAVEMPKVEGMPYDEALKTLKTYGFKDKNIQREDAKDPGAPGRPPLEKGKVFQQDPEAGKQVKTNRVVTLKVSAGAETVLMPNLEGMDEQQAKEAFAKLHLDLDEIKFVTQPHNEIEKGKVIRQVPGPQVQIIPGKSEIAVYLSSGPEMAIVPDLRNLTWNDALKKMQDAGFQVGTVLYDNSFEVPANSVMRQGPQEIGKEYPKGSKIDLWISKGLPPKTITRTYSVKVTPPPDKPLVILIKRSDARGKDQVVVNNEKVTTEKRYSVDFYITPDTQGELEVYENGVLKERKQIPYVE